MRQAVQVFWPLYQALLRYAAPAVLGVIALSFLSLLMLLASLLLPWQLLLLVEGSGSSRWSWLPEDWRVAGLGVAIGMALIMHLLCEWGIGRLSQQGAQRIVRHHAKTGLFPDYAQRARQYFESMARSLSALVLMLVVLVVLAKVYPVLTALLLIYLLGCLALWYLAGRWALLKRSQWSVVQMAKVGWHGGFVFILLGVALSYPYVRTVPLIVIFGAVFAARQALVQCFTALPSWQRLLRQQAAVRQLFLPDAAPVATAASQSPTALDTLLTPAALQPWLQQVAARHHVSHDVTVSTCLMAERGAVAYVEASFAPPSTAVAAEPEAWLLKLFAASRLAVAEHEQAILEVAQAGWPAPRLLSAERERELHVLIFAWPQATEWLNSKERQKHLPMLRRQLLACQLPDALAQRVARSHQPMSRRWEAAIPWARLRQLGSSDEQVALDLLQAQAAPIQALLARLPLQVVLPDLQARRLARTPDGTLMLCNWTRWLYEPVGAGWPASLDTALWQGVLADAARRRPELAGVTPAAMAFVSSLYALLRSSERRDYQAALLVLPLAGQAWQALSAEAQVTTPD